MNRFRCGDAAVRCAEVQPESIAHPLRLWVPAADAHPAGDDPSVRPAG
ncbi:hypothetical protein SAMN05444365_104436 [Micromonospora pattaloongensis]|uniref:Uncharacterized protein n=1 Tax=Micromonospora pattaloongensis TaxID=405436 RepID=A0A1H3PDL2_9ACTN|nr:hypothetical protein [Micromonospora pattaloongensis]SDY98489.1 hypothetical protein SAMN05444365_104436 [Micromonospora pattaloongensis]